ncbi:MAG TPA: hypothetical protein VGF32_24300 [Streptosporangiaceae bacterium]
MPGQPGRGLPERGLPERGLPERGLRSVQRAILGAMMTVAAAVAERRIRRALRRDDSRGPDPGNASGG